MTRADIAVVAVVAALALLAVPVTGLATSHGADGVVLAGPAGRSTVPLGEPGRHEVEGQNGTVTFEVADGQIRVVRADCPDGVCVASGTARPGRPIVCAPNGVSATLAATAGELDAVSR